MPSHLPHSRMILEAPMMVAIMLPKLLTATRVLRAIPDLPFPKTAVKNRLAVNSLDVLISAFGTNDT